MKNVYVGIVNHGVVELSLLRDVFTRVLRDDAAEALPGVQQNSLCAVVGPQDVTGRFNINGAQCSPVDDKARLMLKNMSPIGRFLIRMVEV